jgi:DNA polymerase-3 subunit beta
MKFSTSKTELQKALQKVSKATPTRSTLPILSCLLILTTKKGTIFRATDLEITIQTELPVSVEEEGAACLPIKTLLNITNELPETRVTISIQNQKAKIKTDLGEYDLMSKHADEFPEIPEIGTKQSFNFDSFTLKEIIKTTSFAISKDELKPALTGVLFRIKNSVITAVSTDGHRLVRHINEGFKFKKSIEGDFIAPRKFLSFLLNQELEKKIKVLLGENYIAAESGNDVVITRLIDERFPDYDSVIPKDNKKVLNVSKNEFLSAIRRVSIFSNKSTHQVAVNLKEKQVCNISTEDPEKSTKANESLSVEYKGEELTIGYNAEYLKDVVSHIPTENVIINFNTSISAALFNPDSKEEKSETLMLLMPIRLND